MDSLTHPLPPEGVTCPRATPDTGYDISEWSEFLSIQDLWNEMGLRNEPERLQTRSHKLKDNCHLLLNNILREEQKVMQQLKENIHSFTSEITQTCTQLAIPNPSELSDDNLSLIQRESALRKSLDQLRLVRGEREKRQERLQEMEIAMCLELGDEPTFYQGLSVAIQQSPHFLIKEEQLQEYRQEVQLLEHKLNTHRNKFVSNRNKMIELWRVTGQEPLSDFESLVRDNNRKELTLSSSTLDNMQEVVTRLRLVFDEITELSEETKRDVICLWRRLETPQEEQDVITDKITEVSAKTCRILMSEKNRLLSIKQENIGKFIQKTKELLEEAWDRCYLGPAQRYNMCSLFFSDLPPDEPVLEALESSLKAVYDMERRFMRLYTVVRKREVLWEKFMDLQEKMNDPNRLNNRGGGLLKEAKERNSLEKRIPNLEIEIKKLTTEYTEETGNTFILLDKEYTSVIADQWAERKNTQKVQKASRQQAKADLIKTEMKFGSTPTPKKVNFKRPRPLATPKNAKVIDVKQSNGSAKKLCFGSPRKPITHSSLSRTGGKAKNMRRRMSLAKLRHAAGVTRTPVSPHVTHTLSSKGSPNSTTRTTDKSNESVNFPSYTGLIEVNNASYNQFSQGIDFKARSSCIPTNIDFK
ncbi:Protein regulator of cytokinesis 1-like [Oopsacas minuta]|uniref:Protein regulator of cytokinesis 1-like n=1 Tax=Oopsacas minuta TaxID=111878 RepID=A0AAV7KGS4_9METZ|nr:Protein regulator of cytokinesis 1-like [Oopsacas minuta]